MECLAGEFVQFSCAIAKPFFFFGTGTEYWVMPEVDFVILLTLLKCPQFLGSYASSRSAIQKATLTFKIWR